MITIITCVLFIMIITLTDHRSSWSSLWLLFTHHDTHAHHDHHSDWYLCVFTSPWGAREPETSSHAWQIQCVYNLNCICISIVFVLYYYIFSCLINTICIVFVLLHFFMPDKYNLYCICIITPSHAWQLHFVLYSTNTSSHAWQIQFVVYFTNKSISNRNNF